MLIQQKSDRLKGKSTAGSRQLRRVRCGNRAAFSLIELAAATALMGAVAVTLLPMCYSLQRRQQELLKSGIALQHLSNVMEEVRARASVADIDPEGVEQIPLPEEWNSLFPDATLECEMKEMPGDVTGRRVKLIFHWKNAASGAAREQALSGWLLFPEAEP